MNNYLNEIGRYKLLTAEQERQLSEQIQTATHLQEHLKSSLVTPNKAQARILKRGAHAREHMAAANLRLVVTIAKRYTNRGVSLNDLIQEGSIGLLRACEKFDGTRGCRFSTYACVPTTTEILTRRGWLKYDQVQAGDMTIGYNAEKGQTEWTEVEGVTDYEDAPLLRFGDEHWSTLCTPNHKWLMRDSSGTSLRPIEEWVPGGEMSLVLSAPFAGRGPLPEDLGQALVPGDHSNYTVTEAGRGHVWCPSTALASWTARDENGNVFLTGNTWWIRQSIMRAIADQSRVVRLPVYLYEILSKINHVHNHFQNTQGRPAKEKEVCAELELSAEKIQFFQRSAQSSLSIDNPMPDLDMTLQDTLASDVNCAAQLEFDCLRDALRQALGHLEPIQQKVLIRRYGLDTGVEMTLEQVAHELGISRENVRRQESLAIRKLRRYNLSRLLGDFVK